MRRARSRHERKLVRYAQDLDDSGSQPANRLFETIDVLVGNLPEGEKEVIILRFFEDREHGRKRKQGESAK